MRTDAWYNWHFWWWDIKAWLCYYNIWRCKACKPAYDLDEPTE